MDLFIESPAGRYVCIKTIVLYIVDKLKRVNVFIFIFTQGVMNILRRIPHTLRSPETVDSERYQPIKAHFDILFETFENAASLLQEWVTLGVIKQEKRQKLKRLPLMGRKRFLIVCVQLTTRIIRGDGETSRSKFFPAIFWKYLQREP